MKIHKLAAVNLEDLEAAAMTIIRVDGDRDEDSTSNLTCEQTMAMAGFLRALRRAIEEGDIIIAKAGGDPSPGKPHCGDNLSDEAAYMKMWASLGEKCPTCRATDPYGHEPGCVWLHETPWLEGDPSPETEGK
jgi:hypothetical protein